MKLKNIIFPLTITLMSTNCLANDVEKVVNDYIQAWNTHNETEIATFYAENVEWYDLAQNTTYKGKTVVSKAITDYFLNSVNNMYWIRTGITITEDNSLVYEWEYGGQYNGLWGDVELKNKPFKLKGISITSVNSDGKIVEHRDYYDMSSFEAALLTD